MSNLHGDIAATIANNDPGITTASSTDEYGNPTDSDKIGQQRYGWLGAKQRAADTPTGIILMGVRLYNPTTGRFLQVDPVYGGNANAYDYCSGDPINCYDLDGKIAWGKWIDRAGTGLAVAGLFGCAACAAVAAGISLGRGIYKVSRGDRGGWFDIAGAGAFGAARGVRYFNNVRKSKAIGNAWKGAKGKGRHFRRIRQKASARHRSYNRRVVRKADRIDRRYGYFSTAKQGYDEYRDYRKTRRWY